MTMDLRKFWPAALAVLAATVLGIVGLSVSRSQRFTNLRLDEEAFPSKYLVFGKTNRRRCHVVNRREATMRRSDKRQPGTKWNCSSFESDSGRRAWFLQSKRIGDGTVFLIPAEDVPDWSFPFLYEFVQRQRPDLDLPPSSWIRLFTDRIYQGLYLWVELPFDKRRKDGGSGVLRELLTVRGDTLTVVDSRFNETRTLYVSALADGIFPNLEAPPPELAWLARWVPTEGLTFLVSNQPPHDISLLPLPVDLAELYELKNGKSASMFEDDRYERWTEGSWREGASTQLPFSGDARSRFESEFREYTRRLEAELRAQDKLEGSALLDLITTRQKVAAELGLRPELGDFR